MFSRYIGVDYSGAQTPLASLKGLRVYSADRDRGPTEAGPPPSPKKYWTRRGLADWLVEQLRDGPPTIVGIDHAFSFPRQYFERHGLALDWRAFLDDFQRHWPTDENTYVGIVSDGLHGSASQRRGDTRWRRLTEVRSRSAKSVFHFDVQGQVATSTHAGLPWLRYLRAHLADRVHFWPFDGWGVPPDRSAVVEVYPRMWNAKYARADRTPDQHDAYSVAEALRNADADGSLQRWLMPSLTSEERATAEFEGWILGIL